MVNDRGQRVRLAWSHRQKRFLTGCDSGEKDILTDKSMFTPHHTAIVKVYTNVLEKTFWCKWSKLLGWRIVILEKSSSIGRKALVVINGYLNIVQSFLVLNSIEWRYRKIYIMLDRKSLVFVVKSCISSTILTGKVASIPQNHRSLTKTIKI